MDRKYVIIERLFIIMAVSLFKKSSDISGHQW